MYDLHAFDPSIADLGIEYDPETCWFCAQKATTPMRFSGEINELLYNACTTCALLDEGDEDFYMQGVYRVCNDDLHEWHKTL